MYDPITIFLIVWGLFFVDFFLRLRFLPREIPLAFVVKLLCCCWILSIFACLESFWFLHQIWRTVLLGKVFLVAGSFFSSLWIYSAIPFWLVEFLLRNSWDSLMGVFLYVICHSPLVVFNILPLSLLLVSLIMCQLDFVSLCIPPWVYPAWNALCFLHLVDYFLSHVQEVFRYYLFILFYFLTLQYCIGFAIYMNNFSGPFSLSSPSGTPIMQMLLHLMLSQRSLRLSSFLSFFFLHSALQ